MQYIAFIGGSKSQVPFIKAAIKLGYKVINFDKNINCPGANLSDQFYQISILDIDRIIKKCILLSRKYSLVGVATYSASKSALIAAAKICDYLNLPSFSLSSVELIHNKNIMKKKFKKAHIQSPEYLLSDNLNEISSLINKYKNGIILKPSNGSRGSLGVSIVKDIENLEECFNFAKINSLDGKVIIEEYIKGQEYSIDGIIKNNLPNIISVTKKNNLGSKKNFIMKSFSSLCEKQKITLKKDFTDLNQITKKTLDVLGINNSFFSIDIIIEKDLYMVIECGILLDCKIDRLFWHAGIDIYKEYIKLITGNLENNNFKLEKQLMLEFIFAHKKGVLKKNVNYLENNLKLEWEKEEGEFVFEPKSISDTIGWVIGNPDNIFLSQKKINSTFYIQ